MSAPLASITVAGFRSIESITLDLSSSVTLLIGANGAGKSNIVDAFELLGYTVDGKLGDHVLRSGGFAQMLHRSTGPASADAIVIDAWGSWNGPYRNGYRMRLTSGPDDSALLEETTFTHRHDYEQPYDNRLGLSRESRLTARAHDHSANQYLLDILSGCRVFHFDDTSPSAAPLRFVDVADSESLHSDARNLAAVLLDMKLNHLARYEQVRRSVRNVAPFFDDFVLKPEGGRVLLRWSERGLDGVFSGAALSSGTLRFACLAALLQQPRPPATIVLDEPELGLHPAAIHQLADLMRRTETGRRIVAATQSVTLLGQFTLADIAVVERDNGSTVVHRPDREILEVWLADYSVGELWEMNLLGGRPGSKVTVARTSAA
ncbi:putative ATPase [Rathayibacter sp. PhB151]|uniref:AAA family ATPase n=1 Tax=Rathayibacter sp. PhB151 TaxID=2485189 RepID=UPI00106328C9|nr:AAA family ATPase [Rathayibacter sp. PhB151]TDX81213.1 putative ATPase [Rathayibacter sp. PhB151]